MLRIATPGVPMKTPKPGGTLKGIEFAHSYGLNAMEIEWVQRVPLQPDHMVKIRTIAEKLDFGLTVHAPFFINLNSDKPETIVASKKRIVDAMSMAEIAGAVSVCVHAAFYGTRKDESLDNVRRATDDILKLKNKQFPNVNLAYETMGKHSQFGTLEEVLAVSKEFDIYPCVDVAHMHARANGGINSTEEWDVLLDEYAGVLGKDSLKKMHLHFSGIAYGAKGEKNHVPVLESDAKWENFLKVLKKRKVGGFLVCESPLLEDDTLLLRKTYDAI